MPAHNAAATVRVAVESALAQTIRELEVIVVDDGSDEPLSDLLNDIRDTRLRLLRHSRRQGVSAARNTALAAARAPIVSPLDADDRWEPDYLEAVLPEFDDPAVGLVYADAHVVGGPAGREGWIVDPARHPIDSFPELAGRNLISPPTVSMRTGAVREAGGYATWLYGGSDYYLYLTLARAGWRFAYVDRRLATYRWQKPGSVSYPNARRARADLKLWAAFALRHPLTPGVKKRLAWHLFRTAVYHTPMERLVAARRGY
jgi:glycosyltransferase involved in cell wall biosynthesis